MDQPESSHQLLLQSQQLQSQSQPQPQTPPQLQSQTQSQIHLGVSDEPLDSKPKSKAKSKPKTKRPAAPRKNTRDDRSKKLLDTNISPEITEIMTRHESLSSQPPQPSPMSSVMQMFQLPQQLNYQYTNSSHNSSNEGQPDDYHDDFQSMGPGKMSDALTQRNETMRDILKRQRIIGLGRWFVKLRLHAVLFVIILTGALSCMFYFPYIIQHHFEIQAQQELDDQKALGPNGVFTEVQLDELGLSVGFYECNSIMKVGSIKDNNWTVCWDSIVPRSNCIAYSFQPLVGSLSFEVGLQSLGCQVFVFYSQSEKELPEYRNTRILNGIYTIRMILSDREMGDHWCWSNELCDREEHTLYTIMKMMNHTFVDLVQVSNRSQDTWPVFTQMIHDTPFEEQMIGQLLIELDLLSNPASTTLIEPLQTIRQNEYELFSRIPSIDGDGLRFLLSYTMYANPTPHPVDWTFLNGEIVDFRMLQ